ncbi:MAG: hypothetical protein WBB19_15215 [Desulforhopalus sp.]
MIGCALVERRAAGRRSPSDSRAYQKRDVSEGIETPRSYVADSSHYFSEHLSIRDGNHILII